MPDERAAGVQCVEVIKLPSAPPQYSATITGHQVFYANNVPSNQVIPCSVVFLPGERIGILGACGTTTMNNSYGAGNFATTALGQPITLLRLLTQTNLHTTGGNQPVAAEGLSSIARVEVYVADQSAAIGYGTGSPTGGAPAPTLTTVGMPIPGTTPNLALTQSQSANQGGVLALAFGRNSLPFLGGTLLINAPVLTLPFGTVPSGTTQFLIPLPNDPSLGASVPATWQIVLVSAPGVAMTNGMEWRFGL